jgi:O-6-methylguanine DNA methyltransferase
VIKDHLRTCKSCDESLSDVDELASAVKALALAPPRSCRDSVCEETSDHFDRIEVEGQPVWVGFSSRGVRMITRNESFDAFRASYVKHYGRAIERRSIPEKLRRQVEAALRGEGVDKPLVDLAEMTDFERDVLETLNRIPRGEVRTYQWLARQVGRPKAVRAVGNIVARNVVPFIVPCHRVVPTTGGIGKYAFGSAEKRAILEREGVPVTELDALARSGIRYIGSRTTKIFCFPTCRDARRIREDNRVPFHGAEEATESGYRPCRHCQPVAA